MGQKNIRGLQVLVNKSSIVEFFETTGHLEENGAYKIIALIPSKFHIFKCIREVNAVMLEDKILRCLAQLYKETFCQIIGIKYTGICGTLFNDIIAETI